MYDFGHGIARVAALRPIPRNARHLSEVRRSNQTRGARRKRIKTIRAVDESRRSLSRSDRASHPAHRFTQRIEASVVVRNSGLYSWACSIDLSTRKGVAMPSFRRSLPVSSMSRCSTAPAVTEDRQSAWSGLEARIPELGAHIHETATAAPATQSHTRPPRLRS